MLMKPSEPTRLSPVRIYVLWHPGLDRPDLQKKPATVSPAGFITGSGGLGGAGRKHRNRTLPCPETTVSLIRHGRVFLAEHTPFQFKSL